MTTREIAEKYNIDQVKLERYIVENNIPFKVSANGELIIEKNIDDLVQSANEFTLTPIDHNKKSGNTRPAKGAARSSGNNISKKERIERNEKKSRIVVLVIGILLIVVGFICFYISAKKYLHGHYINANSDYMATWSVALLVAALATMLGCAIAFIDILVLVFTSKPVRNLKEKCIQILGSHRVRSEKKK